MAIVLVIKDMGDVHSVHLSAKPIVLGRSAACDVRISDEKVSGRHLALKLNGQGRVMIKDLETTNGTLLNGANITESFLMIADKLKIGDVELRLDDSQMSPKEKKPLARDDAPTQIKYIQMPGSSSGINKIPIKENPESVQKAPPTEPQKEDEPTVVQKEKESSENQQPAIKDRLLHSSQKVSQDHSNDQDGLEDENIIDRGDPPDSPEELNLSVDQKTKPDNKKKKPSKQKKPKKQSILQGFLQIFKGN